MPKVKFATDIQAISCKLFSKKGVIYSVNKRTGETYHSDRHVINNPNTERHAIRATPWHGSERKERVGEVLCVPLFSEQQYSHPYFCATMRTEGCGGNCRLRFLLRIFFFLLFLFFLFVRKR